MPEEDRQRWNARYAAGEHLRREPDAFFLEALERIESDGLRGRALDLASGTGVHALELARRGWSTAAWDVSDEALRRCHRAASAAGLSVETRSIDLTTPGAFADRRFELVVVVDYLERALLPQLAGLLEPGGWLIYATFTPDWPGPRPSPRFRSDAETLARALAELTPVVRGARPGRAELLLRLL